MITVIRAFVALILFFFTCFATPTHINLRESGRNVTKTGLTEIITLDKIRYSDRRRAFLVQVSIGTPPQQLWLQLKLSEDTRAGAPRTRNNTCTDSSSYYQNCMLAEISDTYQQGESSTFRKVFETKDSNWATDSFAVGTSTIETVSFYVVNSIKPGEAFTFGLTNGKNSPSKSFLDRAVDQGKTSLEAFSVYLNAYGTNQSIIHIGAVDRSKFSGTFATMKLLDETQNAILVDSISYLASHSNPKRGAPTFSYLQAKLDFSLSYIAFGTEIKEYFSKLLDAVVLQMSTKEKKYIATSCDKRMTADKLVFQFSGETQDGTLGNSTLDIAVSMSQLIVPDIDPWGRQVKLPDGKPSCRVLITGLEEAGIDPSNTEVNAVLGAPFARAAYIIHDYTNMEVSIANAVLNKSLTETDMLRLDKGGVWMTKDIYKKKLTGTGSNSSSSKDGVTVTDGSTSKNASGGSKDNGNSSKPNNVAIIGGVGASIAGIALVALWLYIPKRKKKKGEEGISMRSWISKKKNRGKRLSDTYSGHDVYMDGKFELPATPVMARAPPLQSVENFPPLPPRNDFRLKRAVPLVKYPRASLHRSRCVEIMPPVEDTHLPPNTRNEVLLRKAALLVKHPSCLRSSRHGRNESMGQSLLWGSSTSAPSKTTELDMDIPPPAPILEHPPTVPRWRCEKLAGLTVSEGKEIGVSSEYMDHLELPEGPTLPENTPPVPIVEVAPTLISVSKSRKKSRKRVKTLIIPPSKRPIEDDDPLSSPATPAYSILDMYFRDHMSPTSPPPLPPPPISRTSPGAMEGHLPRGSTYKSGCFEMRG